MCMGEKRNREKCREALHRYIDTLDDDGMYNLISDMEIEGDGIFSCSVCSATYGDESCNFADDCEKRFNEWINR